MLNVLIPKFSNLKRKNLALKELFILHCIALVLYIRYSNGREMFLHELLFFHINLCNKKT